MAIWCACILLCAIVVGATAYVSVDVPQSEAEALEALYNSTNGTHWRWRPASYGDVWNFSTPNVSLCDGWQGVTCGSLFGDSALHIVNVTLNSYNLSGTLPSQLAALFALSSLNLDFNHIGGIVPVSICNLTNLEKLALRDNILGGTIPSCLHTNLTNLYSLSLHANLLHGSIPDFDDQHNLRYLSYSRNHLTGTIPSSFVKLKSIEIVYLGINMLHGSLDMIGNATSLRLLSLSSNLFTTTVPASFGQLVDLNYLYLEENYLRGSLPYDFGSLSQLIYLAMYSNLITGSLPQSMSNFSRLIHLSLDSNIFSGSLDESVVSNWTHIEQANLYANLFSGSLPSAFATFSKMTVLLVQRNMLTGNLHSVFNLTLQTAFQAVDVSSNRFTGDIPTSVFGNSLITFVAYDCCFSGSIPSSICDSVQLVTLVLDGLTNACSHRVWPDIPGSPRYAQSVPGRIPACVWTELHNLTTLHVSGNGLSGTIPELASYGQLTDIELAYNSLTGTIPSSLQQWTKLETLNLESNKLVGTIRDMGALQYSYGSDKNGVKLYLGTNRLSGVIPTEIESANQINIVEGNLFSCSFYHEPPQSDPNSDSFTCGSTMVDIALQVFASVGGVIALALLIACCVVYVVYNEHGCSLSWTELVSVIFKNDPEDIQRHLSKLNRGSTSKLEQAKVFCLQTMLWRAWLMRLNENREVRGDCRHLMQFVRSLQCLCRVSIVLTILSVGIGIPMYAVLKTYYKTYTRQYRWEPSGVFLSGYQPALVILVFWAALLFVVLYLISSIPLLLDNANETGMEMHSVRTFQSSSSSVVSDGASSKSSVIFSISSVIEHVRKKSVWMSIAVFCANVMFILVVKGMLVYALVTLSTTYNVKMLITVLLGGLDVFWGAGLVPLIINRLPEISDSGKLMVKLCTVVTNSIFASVISIMLADASCFQGLFVPQRQASEDYYVQFCGLYSVASSECATGYYNSYTTSSYTPVFYYNYNCYSTVITEYVPIFFVSYCLLALAVPLGSICVTNSRTYAKTLASFYPGIFWIEPNLLSYFGKVRSRRNDNIQSLDHKGTVTLQNIRAADVALSVSDHSDRVRAASSTDEGFSDLHDSADSSNNAASSEPHQRRVLFPAFILAASLHHIMVMLTFGLLYPPLNVLLCLLACVTVFTWETLIGRWLLAGANREDGKNYHVAIETRTRKLNAVCASVCCVPQGGLALLSLGSGIFVGLMCWDIAGDQLGWRAALWAPLGALAISLCAFFAVKRTYTISERIGLDRPDHEESIRGSYASDYLEVIRGSSLWKRIVSRSQSSAMPSFPTDALSSEPHRTMSSLEMSNTVKNPINSV